MTPTMGGYQPRPWLAQYGSLKGSGAEPRLIKFRSQLKFSQAINRQSMIIRVPGSDNSVILEPLGGG